MRDGKVSQASWIDRAGLSKNTVKSILKGQSAKTTASTKLAAIDAVFGDEDALLLHLISKRAAIEAHEFDALKSYVGASRYVGRDSNGQMITGDIVIKQSKGLYHFKSYLDGAPARSRKVKAPAKAKEPQHEGLVFRLGPRLVYMGVGRRYFRTMISFNVDAPEAQVSSAIVLTTDKVDHRPMAGLLFIAHEKYSEIESFEQDYLENFEDHAARLHDDPATTGILRA